jgi:hypothetical protein
VPRRERPRHDVNGNIAILRQKLAALCDHAHTDARARAARPFDIGAIVGHARAFVAGRSAPVALARLAYLYGGPGRDRILLSIPAPDAVARDDDRRAATNAGDVRDSDDGRPCPSRTQIAEFDRIIGAVVRTQIAPALAIVRRDHRLVPADFRTYAKGSLLVVGDEQVALGDALHCGYDGNFVAARLALEPLVDTMVRRLLGRRVVAAAADPRRVDDDLGTLLRRPDAARVLGGDLAFEIDAVFCAPGHERSHDGLDVLPDLQIPAIRRIYAWWLVLRIVLASYWNEHSA